MICDSSLPRKRKRSLSPSDASSVAETARSTNDDAPTPLTPLTPSTPRPVYPSERKTFVCVYEDCGKAYNRPARLQDHLRSHTDERPFKCSDESCDKSFRRRSHLSQHIKSSHSSIREYSCEFNGCSKRFLTATRLKRHTEVHLGHNKYRCVEYPPCNETFRKKVTLQKHIDVAHLRRKPFRCAHVRPETGEECGAGYDSAAKLHTHTTRVHGPGRGKYICTFCHGGSTIESPASFFSHSELQKHMKLMHPPTCEQCGLRCSSPYELSNHIDTKHSNKMLEQRRVFKCTANGCEKSFTKRSNLNVHTRSAHTASLSKAFVCGATDLSGFTDANVAAWDMQSGCGKGFTAKASLTSHIRKQHLAKPRPRKERNERRVDSTNEEETSALSRLTGTTAAREVRAIACVEPDCAWRFKREHDLRNHARRLHGLTDSEITEAILEREALSGGCFWFGDVDVPGHEEEEEVHKGWEATRLDDEDTWNVRESGLPIASLSPSEFGHDPEQLDATAGGAIDPDLM